jgi:hypothetical protein
MEIKKLEKDLIFFVPGKPGPVFTYSAGFAMNNDLLDQTVAGLEYDTEAEVHYANAENQARAERLGLWADKNPTAPWQWRRERRKGNAKYS